MSVTKTCSTGTGDGILRSSIGYSTRHIAARIKYQHYHTHSHHHYPYRLKQQQQQHHATSPSFTSPPICIFMRQYNVSTCLSTIVSNQSIHSSVHHSWSSSPSSLHRYLSTSYNAQITNPNRYKKVNIN